MLPMLALSAASSASQMLASLLSSITGSTSSSSSNTSSDTASTSTSSTPACSGTGMTGSTQGALSGDVLMTLMAMQQQSASASSSASSASSTISASTLSASDPLQQLFAAMDSNGDGSVSESEMESYIEGVGGTQADADSLYTALSSQTASTTSATGASSTAGITESQMASALSQAQAAQSGQAGGAHHHHHHHGAGGGGQNQADGVANTLLQALDTNDDGSVSESEFTSFVPANGGTAADASSDFAALNSSGSGSLTSADFAKAWSNLQAQQTSQSSGSMVVSLLDAFAKAGSTAGAAATTSVSA